MLSILLLVALAFAECPGLVSTYQLNSTLDTAHYAYLTMDPDGFQASMEQAYGAIPCLSETLSDTLVASFYLQVALDHFLVGDESGVVQAFRSLLDIEPSYQLPDNLAPPRHALRTLFSQARMAPPSPTTPLPAPNRGWLAVDGEASSVAPTDRPYLLQVVNSAGTPTLSAYLRPGDPLPEYPVDALAVPGDSGRSARSWNVPLLVAAAGSALASGTLYALASRSSATFEDPATKCEDLDGLRSQTNLLVTSSAVTGAVALGVGVAAVFVVRF